MDTTQNIQKSELLNTAPDETPSFGMQLVGITFNPSGDPKVNRLKQLAAEMADIVENDSRGKVETVLYSIIKKSALQEILNAQMNAVKLVTLKY